MQAKKRVRRGSKKSDESERREEIGRFNGAILRRLKSHYDIEKNARLAELFDVSVQSISNYKSGLRELPFPKLVEISQKEGLSLDWLINGTEQKIENQTTNNQGKETIDAMKDYLNVLKGTVEALKEQNQLLRTRIAYLESLLECDNGNP